MSRSLYGNKANTIPITMNLINRFPAFVNTFNRRFFTSGYGFRTVMVLLVQLVITCLNPQTALSQDLYNRDNSFRYAQFLFETRQFQLAAEEFERVLFLDPDNDTVKQQLIKSYLLGHQYAMVNRRTDSLFRVRESIPRELAIDYSKALIMAEMNFNASQFITSNLNLNKNDRLFLSMNNQLMGYEWDKAKLTYEELHPAGFLYDKKYAEIFRQMDEARYKSGGIALGLSAVVPGLGKVYTGNWKDGLISFIFVAGSTIQAIRGYHQYGRQSAFFIVYTGLAATFYAGNLYGSFKAARKHNRKVNQKIHSHIETVFSDTF